MLPAPTPTGHHWPLFSAWTLTCVTQLPECSHPAHSSPREQCRNCCRKQLLGRVCRWQGGVARLTGCGLEHPSVPNASEEAPSLLALALAKTTSKPNPSPLLSSFSEGEINNDQKPTPPFFWRFLLQSKISPKTGCCSCSKEGFASKKGTQTRGGRGEKRMEVQWEGCIWSKEDLQCR